MPVGDIPTMPTLKAVRSEDFPTVYEQQLRTLAGSVDEARWRTLLFPPWMNGSEEVGYGLFEGDRVVGFAGYVRSEQQTAGGVRPFINISSWVVDEAHRHAAMALIMPAIKEKHAVLTNLTPLASVHAIFSKLGFGVLETHTRMHVYVPSVGHGSTVQFDEEIVPATLTTVQETVHRSHRSVARTARIAGRHGACYVVYTVVRRRGLPSVRLHHIAPRDGLAWALRPLQTAVLVRHGATLVEYDRRLAVGAPGPFVDRPVTPNRLYRGRDIVPEDVSNAYSELVLLNI